MLASCAWDEYLGEMPVPGTLTSHNSTEQEDSIENVVYSGNRNPYGEDEISYWLPVGINIYNHIVDYDLVDVTAKIMSNGEELFSLSDNKVFFRGDSVGYISAEADGSLFDIKRAETAYYIEWTKKLPIESLDYPNYLILDFYIRCIDGTGERNHVRFEHELCTSMFPNYRVWNIKIVPDGEGMRLDYNNITLKIDLHAVQFDASVDGWKDDGKTPIGD